MKTIILTTLIICVSVVCFGRKTYTMSKLDFVNQFSGKVTKGNQSGLLGSSGGSLGKIYCYNENDKKVLLVYNSNTQLKLQLNNNSVKLLLLHTVSCINDSILAIEYNVWAPGNKISYFNINDVKAFTVEDKYREQVLPYFNSDSSRQVARLKNDSVEQSYSSGKEYVVSLVAKQKKGSDAISLRAGACYHINFKDGNQTLYGAVHMITSDSIIITSHFNENMAVVSKQKWDTFRYAITDIAALRLLKSGGYTTRTVSVEEYHIIVEEKDKQFIGPAVWYAVHPQKGEVNLYRSFLVDGGYKGIKENDGKAIWYEGE